MAVEKQERRQASVNIHMTKKCPECFAYLPLQATTCTSCGKAVGPVNKLGHAAKPVNVRAYLIAAAAIAAFAAFVWWGFFTD
jgi:ribosomal protein L40E